MGSKLKSRIIAEQSITKWSRKIEEMEDKVAEVIEEERFVLFHIQSYFSSFLYHTYRF